MTDNELLKAIQEDMRLLRRDIIKSSILKDAIKVVVAENKRLRKEAKQNETPLSGKISGDRAVLTEK